MIKVVTSTVINASLAKVWEIVSDFNGLPSWHPAAGESRIEDGKANNEIGCVRNFSLKDDSGRVRETLLALSSIEHEIVYDMIGGPLPFVDYISKMHFEEITDNGKTFARWSADFNVSDGQDGHWQKFVADDVFLGGFRALESVASRR